MAIQILDGPGIPEPPEPPPGSDYEYEAGPGPDYEYEGVPPDYEYAPGEPPEYEYTPSEPGEPPPPPSWMDNPEVGGLHEPASFEPWLRHDSSFVPRDQDFLSHLGWSRWGSATLPNYSTVGDTTFPTGIRDVTRILYPNGHNDGHSPGRWFGSDVVGLGNSTPLKRWYVSIWIRFVPGPGGTWQMPPAAQKFWYNSVGSRSRANTMSCGVRWASDANNQLVGGGQLGTQWRRYYQHHCPPGGNVALPNCNPGEGPVISQLWPVGPWKRVELVADFGTVGNNDASFFVYIDGQLYHSRVNFNWAGQPGENFGLGFYQFHWAPVYGGSCSAGCAKTRDDVMYQGPVYVSGIAQ